MRRILALKVKSMKFFGTISGTLGEVLAEASN
jgi:hypothetical protein